MAPYELYAKDFCLEAAVHIKFSFVRKLRKKDDWKRGETMSVTRLV